MTGLHDALGDYLGLRRSLGFSLQRDAKLLASSSLTYSSRERAPSPWPTR